MACSAEVAFGVIFVFGKAFFDSAYSRFVDVALTRADREREPRGCEGNLP